MKIINLYKNLQERERKLVLISFVLIIFLILYFSFMNVYSSYTRSSINLAKAKSDYEYVYNKVKLFESSNNKKNLSSENIERIIIDNSFQDNILNQKISSFSNFKFIQSTINFLCKLN